MTFYDDSHKRRKGGRKEWREEKREEGTGWEEERYGKTKFSLVDSKGKLIDQTGLYVKRLVTKKIRSKYNWQIHHYLF